MTRDQKLFVIQCTSLEKMERFLRLGGLGGGIGQVMGLMLGEFVDEYTVNVIDVFAMPQSGTGVSVEAVDPVFQAKMLDMLKQTGRPEMVVGWYHSHPGFGCWLSGVDVNTQQSFEALSNRAVAVVVDPIQSVKGKVVIDAFRTINPQTMAQNQEPRQTTSNLGHLQKPSIQRSGEDCSACSGIGKKILNGDELVMQKTVKKHASEQMSVMDCYWEEKR
ncbi:Mov34/MPN/PAD-1 family protein [Teladorsagia circumcincta]|uniref:Mov34/MPN/PAD-1 family protein n=1 Tax=Teladorsagia circumcincta TaxID=45464 RepID=A0A2G9TQI3_TELCI|nr:Mov34/MPN/PAD-1 family protein [Teladorsagia circumcincta]